VGKIEELYETRVRSMAPAERLQLARLILDDLAPAEQVVDVSDAWSDDDLAEAAAYSAQHGGKTDAGSER
jgi:hypothetical protein